MYRGIKNALILLGTALVVWFSLQCLLPLGLPFLLGGALALAAEPMTAFLCSRLNLHLSDLVAEIIIGPTSSQSLPILQDYLSDCGLNVLKEKIHMSNCPLRKPTS